ncbi:MAG: hypothetical protein ABR548_11655 [Actinomycetota bacterium]
MEKGVHLRPKYASRMEAFLDVEVANVKKVIEDQTWDQFDDAFEKMVSQANAYHELFDKPFLRWKVPDMPPPDLDLTPR